VVHDQLISADLRAILMRSQTTTRFRPHGSDSNICIRSGPDISGHSGGAQPVLASRSLSREFTDATDSPLASRCPTGTPSNLIFMSLGLRPACLALAATRASASNRKSWTTANPMWTAAAAGHPAVHHGDAEGLAKRF